MTAQGRATEAPDDGPRTPPCEEKTPDGCNVNTERVSGFLPCHKSPSTAELGQEEQSPHVSYYKSPSRQVNNEMSHTDCFGPMRFPMFLRAFHICSFRQT